MVAIVTGNGLGLFNASSSILGSAGILGQGWLEQSNGRSFVNAATGNLVLQSQDEVLSGRGADLLGLRTYNSSGQLSDGLGMGWDFDGERKVVLTGTVNTTGSTVKRTAGDGSETTFAFDGTRYLSTDGSGAHDTLEYSASATADMRWTFIDGSTRLVERYGTTSSATTWRLTHQSDVSGNTISYSYDSSGRLTTIIDNSQVDANGNGTGVGSGQKIVLTYGSVGNPAVTRLTRMDTYELTVDGSGRATTTLGAAIKQVVYGYYDDGRLKSVTTDLTPLITADSNDPKTLFKTFYTYDGTSNRIASLLQGNDSLTETSNIGFKVAFTYEQVGTSSTYRVKTVTDTSGVQTFIYNATSTDIKFSDDAAGTVNVRTWTYSFDASKQLTKIDSPEPTTGVGRLETTFEYETAAGHTGNVKKITHLNTKDNAVINAVIYQYDANGNRLIERDLAGDTIARTYDGKNQLQTETRYTIPDAGLDENTIGIGNAQGALTTRYIYEAGTAGSTSTRLRFIVSAEGRVTEMRYGTGVNDFGLLTQSIAYADIRYPVAGLTLTSSPLTEADLTAWVNSTPRDKTQTQITRYDFDYRGNIAQRTDYASADTTGAGVLDAGTTVNSFIYDARGLLLKTIALRGQGRTQTAELTAFTYDGMNRELTRTVGGDDNTKQTTLYDDKNNAITVTTAAQLQTVRTYNTQGLLTSVLRADLNVGAAPTRGTQYLYDGQGRLAMTQEITGKDPNNSNAFIFGARRFSFYDDANRLKFSVDATGAICGYTYNEIGQTKTQICYATRLPPGTTDSWLDNPATPTKVTKAMLVPGTDFTTSSDDRTTTYDYDSVGRLSKITDAAGTAVITAYDGASRVTTKTVKDAFGQSPDRVTRLFYDFDGKTVGTVDPLGYLIENKYDASARLVETIRYATRSPGVADNAPVWKGVANQNVSIGRPFSYHLPAAYDSDGDALIYSFVSKPSWVNFDASGITLSGTPPKGFTTGSVVLKVDDGRGLPPTQVTVLLTAVNGPPSLGEIADVSVEVKTAGFSLALPVPTDNESTAAQLKFTIDSTLLPAGLSFNGSPTQPTISGTPTIAGNYVITAHVEDPQGLFVERTFVLRVTNKGPKWAPDFSGLPHAFRTQVFNYAVSPASDPESQSLTYRIVSGPSWLKLPNTSTPALTGTPPVGTTAGAAAVVLEAKDSDGAIVRVSFSITVEGVPPQWPDVLQFSTPAGQPISYTPPPAVDPDQGGALVYDFYGDVPPQLSGLQIDHTNGKLTLAATDVHNVGTYQVTLQAKDVETKIVTNTVTIVLLNTAPVYVGGLNDEHGGNYNDYRFNPKTVLVPYSAFSDLNGPVTLSVEGATPGMLQFRAGTDPWVPGLYFEPNYTFPGEPVHGAADQPGTTPDEPQDNGVRPVGVLTWYDPTVALGAVKWVKIIATDSSGATVEHWVSITVIAIPTAPPPPAPPAPPPGPPPPPDSPPTLPQVMVPGGGGMDTIVPIASLGSAPAPILAEVDPSPPVGGVIDPAPAPLQAAVLPPLQDVLADWRPAAAPADLHTFYFYDDLGRIRGVVDQRSFLTETVYNEQDNFRQTIQYKGFVTSVAATDTLDDVRTHALQQDPGSNTTTIAYDSVGRLSTSTTQDQTVTSVVYDATGRVIRKVIGSTTADQRAIRTRFDAFDEVIGLVSGVGEATLSGAPTQAQIDAAIVAYGTQYQYDELGRKTQTIDANNHKSFFFYDTENRLEHAVNAAGEVSERLYNAFGEVSSDGGYANRLSGTQLGNLKGGADAALTLPALNPTDDRFNSYLYDARGSLKKKTDALGFVTNNTYNGFGQLDTRSRTITQATAGGAAAVTTLSQFDYDLDGQLIAQTDDFGGLNFNTRRIYDPFGRVSKSIDAAGNITTTTYDNGGRSIQVTDPLNRAVRDDYDALGRVVTHTDALSKVTTYFFDDVNRTLKVTTPEGVQITTTRTAFGETLSVKDSRGNITKYDYNKDGHLVSVADPVNGAVDKFQTINHYDSSGRLDLTTDARGIAIKLEYDAADRVMTRTVDPSIKDPNDATKFVYVGLNIVTSYEFTAFGEQLKVIEGPRVTVYKRDRAAQLTNIIVDPDGLNFTTTYGYDGIGNKVSVHRGKGSASSEATVYVFDKLGRQVKQIAAPGKDADGTALFGVGPANARDLVTEFRYDTAGRLSRKIDALGQSTWFVYDVSGQLKYTINALGEVTFTDYDAAGQVLQTRSFATRLAATTVAGFGDAIATFTPPAVSNDDVVTRSVYDGDGNLRFTLRWTTAAWAVTENRFDASANIVESRQYDQQVSNPATFTTADIYAALRARGYKDVSIGSTTTDENTLKLINRRRFAYDTDDRLRFTVNALGTVSESIYDETGNVVKKVRYATIPTLTSYTESAIDGAVNRSNAENQVTRLAYDDAARLTYTIQVLAVDGTGNATKQVINRIDYDSLGNVVLNRSYATTQLSVADYKSATLDAAVAAPAVANHPQNRTTAYAYDLLGRRNYAVDIFAVDSTGKATKHLITKQTYDALNRVVQTTRYATVFGALADYSLATLDTAVLPNSVAGNTQNHTDVSVYDLAGRRVYSIRVLAADGTGKATQEFVTRQNYDAAGHAVETTSYATPFSVADFKQATLDSATAKNTSDQDRSTLSVYDAAGRDVYDVQSVVTDTSGKTTQRVTRITYDALGRAVLTTIYATPLILADFRKATLDSAVTATAVANNPLNRTIASVYDAVDEELYHINVLAVDNNGKPTQQIVTQQVFDTFGHVVKAVAYNGVFALADYKKVTLDNAVKATTVAADPLNRITAYAFDGAGQRVYRVRVNAVDANGKPTQEFVEKSVYNSLGLVTQTIGYAGTFALVDFRGSTIDTAVKLAQFANDAKNRSSASAYDTLGRRAYSLQTLAVDSSGKPTQQLVTRLTYDAFGDIIQTTAFATPMVPGDYKLATLDTTVAAHTSALDRTTRYVFDVLGRSRFTLRADGTLAETVYDPHGQTTEIRVFAKFFTFDPNKSYTEADLASLRGNANVGDGITRGLKKSYDRAGRLISTTDAAKHVESYVLDGIGNLTSLTDKNGNVWTYTYDALGQKRSELSPQLTSIRLSDGSSPPGDRLLTSLDYDVFGDLVGRTEAANTIDARTTTYGYDTMGRQTGITQPGWYVPSSGTIVYLAPNGQPPAGSFQRVRENLYDTFGDLIRTRTKIDVNSYVYQYHTFDALGRETYRVDELNNVTGFLYNAFDEQRESTRYGVDLGAPSGGQGVGLWTTALIDGLVANDPLARRITTEYDNVGRISQVTQPTVTSYYLTGGALQPPSSVTPVSGAATVKYEYSAFGEIFHEARKVDDIGTDGVGRPGHWRDTWHYFDNMGRESRTVDALNFHTARTYDELGNLKQVVEYAVVGSSAVSGVFTPPPVPGNNVKDRITGFTYDALNQQTKILRYGLSYFDTVAGSMVANSRTTATTVMSQTYDAMGHVLTETDALTNIVTHSYDELGRVKQTIEPLRAVASAGNVDPFKGAPIAPATNFVYNGFGQLVQQTRGALITKMAYDFGGNLISVTDPNGFDGAGNPVADVDNHTKHRQYDYAGRLIKETQAININVGLIAGVSISGWQTVAQTLERRYGYDLAGEQTEITDVFTDNGIATQTGRRKQYNAFGNVTDEYVISGVATTALANLTGFKVRHANFDNAGYMSDTSGASGTSKYFYNLAGQVTREEDLNDATTDDGSVTRIAETDYDALNRATTKRLPTFMSTETAAGSTPTTVYTTIVQQYDRWGNATQVSRQGTVFGSGGAISSTRTTTYDYNADNNVIAEHTPVASIYKEDGTAFRASVTHEQHYDVLSRMVQQFDSVGDDVATQANEANPRLRGRDIRYDAAGEKISESDYRGFLTQYAYDENGNQVGKKDALGHVYVDTFDNNGNTTSHGVLRLADFLHGLGVAVPYTGSGTPLDSMLTVYQYDQAGRRVASADLVGADSYLTLSQYDERNFVRATFKMETLPDTPWDPALIGRLTTTCSYDVWGNKVSETDVSHNTQTWEYNVNPAAGDFTFGRLSRTTVRGLTTDYKYNDFGQLRLETYAGPGISTVPGDKTDRVYTYHNNGMLKSLTDESVFGTIGPVGDDDYLQQSNTTNYEYTALGEVAKQRFQRAGVAETADRVFNDQTGTFDIVRLNAPAPFTNPVDQVTTTTYDELGRVATVVSPAGAQTGSTLSELRYRYDQFGNRVEIRATYTPQGGGATTVDKWFKYDSDGRVTLADGALQNGQIVSINSGGVQSTAIIYDELGRRATTEKFVRNKTYTFLDPDRNPGSSDPFTQIWDEFSLERYTYNDLNYLTLTEQRYDRRNGVEFDPRVFGPNFLGDQDGNWVNLEVRGVDQIGRVRGSTRYTQVYGSDANPLIVGGGAAATQTTLNYARGTYGNMDSQLVRNLLNPDQDNPANDTALTIFHYDGGGILRSTDRTTGGEPHHPGPNTQHTTTTAYTYKFVFGKYGEDTVTVTDNQHRELNGQTRDGYDARGNLIVQTQATDHRTITKTFGYDVNGHIAEKAVLDTNPASFGRADYFYANGQSVGTIGSGSLSSATQFDTNFTPISDSYPATTPGNYTVIAGDTLAGIAQSVYGDAQLWYVIADANSLSFGPTDALPSIEVGKNYRIPSVVANRNNADTFKPYNPADIIGSSVPAYGAPPPPSDCEKAERVLMAAVVVAAQIVVTALVTAATRNPMLGAMAGSMVGQSVATGFGMQEGIDGGRVVQAGITAGFTQGISSAINGYEAGIASNALMDPNTGELNTVFDVGGGFTNSYANMAQDAIISFGANSATALATGGKIDVGNALASLGTQLAVHGAFSQFGDTSGASSRFNWLGGAESFAANSLNPDSGWVFNDRSWANIAAQSMSALGNVAAGAINWKKPDTGSGRHYAPLSKEEIDILGESEENIDAFYQWKAAEKAYKEYYAGPPVLVSSLGWQGGQVGYYEFDPDDMNANWRGKVPDAGGTSYTHTWIVNEDGTRVQASYDAVDESKQVGEAKYYLKGSKNPYAVKSLDGTVTRIEEQNPFDGLSEDAADAWALDPNHAKQIEVINRDAVEARIRARQVLVPERVVSYGYGIGSDAYKTHIPAVLGPPRAAEILDAYDRSRNNQSHIGDPAFDVQRQLIVDQVNHDRRRAETDITTEYDQRVELAKTIAGIQGRPWRDVLQNKPRGLLESYGLGFIEAPLVLTDAVRLAFVHDARPLSQYGQQREINVELGGSKWDGVGLAVVGNVPVLGQTVGAISLAASIGDPNFGDNVGQALGGATFGFALNGAIGGLGSPNEGAFGPRPSMGSEASPPTSVQESALTVNQVGPASSGGSGSYYPSRQGVLNGLRSSGSVHGIGIADAIDNGTLDLTILPTDPSGRGARGSYGIGSNEIVLHADQFLSDQQAAGGAGHEGTHWFQDLTGQFVDQSGRLTYHRGLEFEAFLAQREIDPTHWANGLSDRSLMFKVKYLYPDVKPAPPVWTPTRY